MGRAPKALDSLIRGCHPGAGRTDGWVESSVTKAYEKFKVQALAPGLSRDHTTSSFLSLMNRLSSSWTRTWTETVRHVSGRARRAARATRVVVRSANSRGSSANPTDDSGNNIDPIDMQIARTITRIRDAEDSGGFNHAMLLTLAMQLSLECELAAAGSPPAMSNSNVSRATWTLQRIKGMADQARRLFLEAVKDDDLQDDEGPGYCEQVRRHPLSLIDSISRVFHEQGYRKMNSWADFQAFSFAQVVERGAGSPLTIAILYQAVAREANLVLDLVVLEEGNYAVLSMGMWVIDPYSKCLLMSAEEVAELFDVDLPLRPSSLREVSIALVKQRLFFEWSSITGVYEPAFRLPLDGEEGLELALGCFEDVSFSYGSSADEREDGPEAAGPEGAISPFFLVQDDRGQECLANCVRAAEKLRILQRDAPHSRIRHAVLLYALKHARSLDPSMYESDCPSSLTRSPSSSVPLTGTTTKDTVTPRRSSTAC